MDVSIIIVTRNRAEDLRQTLDAMRCLRVPDGCEAEMLVVDNGSSDDTAGVVRAAAPGDIPVRYVCEPQPGQTQGRNRGLAETTGDIILFTDDDVRPPVDWIAGMCDPIVSGSAKAVAGGVTLAPGLIRPWMTRMHRSWLASTEWLTPGAPQSMVGANMAFSRSVLKQVPGFDLELGPGAAGFGDDELFASQLVAAGNKIHDATSVSIEHHFEPARLTRESWLSAARRRGESLAYTGHHWKHWGCRFGRLKVLRAKAELTAWRARNRDKTTGDGCCEQELNLIFLLATFEEHVRQAARNRNYEKHGLVKLQHSR